jgi:hypothetical protein
MCDARKPVRGSPFVVYGNRFSPLFPLSFALISTKVPRSSLASGAHSVGTHFCPLAFGADTFGGPSCTRCLPSFCAQMNLTPYLYLLAVVAAEVPFDLVMYNYDDHCFPRLSHNGRFMIFGTGAPSTLATLDYVSNKNMYVLIPPFFLPHPKLTPAIRFASTAWRLISKRKK